MKKNQKILIVLSLIVLALIVFSTVKKNNGDEVVPNQEVSPYLNSQIDIKTFEGEKGWGYDIFIDGEQYVHQPNVPSLPGDGGFKTEADARKVAELAVQKIRDNILPPSITPEELAELRVQ